MRLMLLAAELDEASDGGVFLFFYKMMSNSQSLQFQSIQHFIISSLTVHGPLHAHKKAAS